MIGKSTAEYIFIRCTILFLHNIAPFSVIYCILLICSQSVLPGLQLNRVPLPIQVWFIAEAIFFFMIFLPHKYFLSRSTIDLEPLTESERNELFKRVSINIPEIQRFLKGWFVGADLDKVKRENVKDFIRWAFFNNLPGDREAEDDVELYTREIEALQGRPFPEGKSSGLEHLGQKLEKTDGLHRSLLWYLVGTLFIYDSLKLKFDTALIISTGHFHCRRYHLLFDDIQGFLLLPNRLHQILQGLPSASLYSLFSEEVTSAASQLLVSRAQSKRPTTCAFPPRNRRRAVALHDFPERVSQSWKERRYWHHRS